MKSTTLYLLSIFTLCLLTHSTTQAEVVTIQSKNGKDMIVTLLSRKGDDVVIRRSSDGKEFTISPDNLSKESANLVRAKMKTLKAALPPLETVVSISKRRKVDSNSSYMKNMDISAKITITNKDYKTPCPPCTANIIFIGQDQRDTKKFSVLSNQEYTVTPSPKGSEKTTATFSTRYDSDNRGEGNIGGYKYVGYLLVITDPDKTVIHTKTVYSAMKKALEFNVSAAATLKKYPAKTTLNEHMMKPKATVTKGIRKL